MGYDIHITRATDWSDNRGEEISEREWRTLIEEDPELEHNPAYGDHAVHWRGEGSPPDAWFDWYRGNVYTTNPDRAVLAKALRIAAFLDAHVEGDDGKIYCGAEDSAELSA